MRRCLPAVIVTALALLAELHVNGQMAPNVTYERLLNAANEPQNWLTYSGTYASNRYSRLTQITPENAGNLEL